MVADSHRSLLRFFFLEMLEVRFLDLRQLLLRLFSTKTPQARFIDRPWALLLTFCHEGKCAGTSVAFCEGVWASRHSGKMRAFAGQKLLQWYRSLLA